MKKSKSIPSSSNDIRDIIDEMPTETHDDRVYQNSFRYLFLSAARPSEITGQYAPMGKDAHRVMINGEPAVLFVQRTARRSGLKRPIALPLDARYEPWAELLLTFFEENRDRNPFELETAPKSTRRYLQYKSENVFKGLEWPVEKYSKTVQKTVDTKVIKKRERDGVTEYLVEYEDEERHWVENPNKIKSTETIPANVRPFSLQSLRHLRIQDLKLFYNFSNSQIEIFTGLKRSNPDAPFSTLGRYSYLKPTIDSELDLMLYSASSYFDNLLKPKA